MTRREERAPALVGSPDRLTGREWRLVAAATLAPTLLVAVVLVPVALLTGASAGEVAGASLVYGGLLGLAAAFVAVDRLQARQCPVCHRRHARGTPCCGCGYDLRARPRFACDLRHADYLEPGVCECGRRLQRLEPARGMGPQVLVVLKVGAWLLAFLVAVALVLRLLEGRL